MVESGLQCGPFQSQPGGRAIGPAQPSVALAQRTKDLFALSYDNIVMISNVVSSGFALEFEEWSLQHRTGCQNDGALYKIFQFADVPRPLPAHQHLHRLGGNASNG